MIKGLMILLIGMFLMISSLSFVSAVLTNVTLLSDDFEGGNFNSWIDNGVTDWDLAVDQFVSGATSAHVGLNQNDLYSNNTDMSNAVRIYVNFSYRINGIDPNDNIAIYYYDGAAYDLINEIGDDAEATWINYAHTITDTQYFDNGFHIYFEGSSIDNNEDLWIDDFYIIKEYNFSYAPNMTNITASHSTIQGGDTITIYANTSEHGVNDSEGDTLFLYCDNSTTPTAGNTDCTGGLQQMPLILMH